LVNAESHDHDDDHGRVTRRVAIQLGAGAGAAALAMPYVTFNDSSVDAYLLDRAQLALRPIPGWPVPRVITRAQWGANEGLRKPGQSYDSSIAKLIVHHTGTPNSVTNYAALARGILANETAGAYLDIAYNWLIDPLGNIYEGRWARDYPAGSPHTGERDGANVRGAHASNHNTRTIGIALMGNYDLIPPSGAMLDALVRLLAWKCARWGIDPRGRGIYSTSNLFHVCGHRDVNATACPGAHVYARLPWIRQQVAQRVLGGGYWIASQNGRVEAFGGASHHGDVRGRQLVGIAGHPDGKGYWLAGPNGAVYAFGSARHHGDMRNRVLSAPVVGIAAHSSGKGYWLVGRDGGIFTFGRARFHGSTGGLPLVAPVLGMAPTKTGHGYWLYARDGGVFSFGDAKFHGSTGGMRLWAPVVSMESARRGYWLIAADGGLFAFGGVHFAGSAASYPSSSPCVGMLSTPSGRGYVFLRRDGSVWAFGDAQYLGGANGIINSPAVGIAGKLK
jgi:hypothetical protein